MGAGGRKWGGEWGKIALVSFMRCRVSSTFHKVLKLFKTKHMSEAMLVFPQVGTHEEVWKVFLYIYVFKWSHLIPTGFSSKCM